MTYLALAMALGAWFVLHNTMQGSRIRATGENPRAAQSYGINPIRLRTASLFFAGFMAGLGGAFMVVAVMGRFIENISAGRGFIALAVTILGRWNPLGALAGALGYGFFDGLQLRLQARGVALPYQFMVALPYAVTFVSLIFLGRNAHAPKALGQSYAKDGR
jgi:simple sugar transport system permease protein